MTIGEKIKAIRKQRGLTQEELGEMIGVKKAAINKYETGVVVNLKKTTIQDIAAALRVSPVWLMDEVSGIGDESEDDRLLKAFHAADPTYRAFALEILESHPMNKEE